MRLVQQWLALSLWSTLFLYGIAQADEQYKECIGAYELSFPDEIEFALFPESYIIKPESSAEAVLSNGSTISAVRFFPGRYVGIMSAPDVTSLTSLKIQVASNMERHKQELMRRGRDEIAEAQVFFDLQRPNSFSIRGISAIDHYEWMNGNIYHFGARNGKFADNVAELKKFLMDFHLRRPYETVRGGRICMPYADVKLTFEAERELSVAMLLKDHPEVEIHFKDILYKVTGHSEPLYGPEHQLTYHWEQRNRGDYSKVDYSWPKFENFGVDGMKGKSTAVTLFRAGGPKDRGFAAYANSEKDGIRRELMLIVTRNTSRASGTPISTDEFDKLAKAIAHSIRRRAP